MLSQILLLGISVKLLIDEVLQLKKKQNVLLDDCMIVQSSGRAMSIQMLNFWTVVTVSGSILYLGGAVFIGAVPSKIIYQMALYQLFTTFMDYSFMSGLRDCDSSDTLRWRIDAFLRCTLYMWVITFVPGNLLRTLL